MTPTRRMLCASLAALSLAALEAQAQGMPRRERGGSPRDANARDATPRGAPAAPAAEPLAALERELASLNVDLMLSAAQVGPWRAFERDVRDAAEMDRARRRHAAALREAGERGPTMPSVIASLAEDDRLKAEASAELKRHADALYDALDERQRAMLDRRVQQSQAEPLGR